MSSETVGWTSVRATRPAPIRLAVAIAGVALYLAPPFTSVYELHLDWPWDGFWTMRLSVGGVLELLPFFLLLPRVSYRRRDILVFCFVPIYLAAKVGWRAANLPMRDWPPRPGTARI